VLPHQNPQRTEGTAQAGGLYEWFVVTRQVFYGEELLAPRPTTKLEDHPLSDVPDCLFCIFAPNLWTMCGLSY